VILRAFVVTLVGTGAALWFALAALDHARGPGAPFAGCLIGLVAAAVAGPFLFDERGVRPAAVRALLLGVGAAALCGVLALLREGPFWAAATCGLFCGLFAFALATVADLLGGDLWRPLLALLGVALVATLFYWDDAFLLRASDRDTSAALAFAINPAAAVSATLDFDWVHAKALYTDNQTAESMVNVARRGIGTYSLGLIAVAIPAAGLGAWRRR
jgi:hypothetical protein